MASTSRAEAKTVKSFFKVILQSTVEAKKMKIPENYAKKSGDQISDSVRLAAQDGRVWEIVIKRKGGNIWLKGGWHDFMQYYSISAGYFLVFMFESYSTYRIRIFDQSACDIEYPKHDQSLEDDEQNSVNTDEVESVENVDIIGDASDKEDKHHQIKRIGQDEFLAFLEHKGIHIRRNGVAAEEREKAMKAVKLFMPRYPSFMVFLRSYFISNNFLYVPTVFCKKYLNNGVVSVKLQVSDRKEWIVQLRKHYAAFVLSRGWPDFVKGNDLQENDILLFELVRIMDILLKVKLAPVQNNAGQDAGWMGIGVYGVPPLKIQQNN